MFELMYVLHYLIVGLLIVVPSACVAWGQGKSSERALAATDTQPRAAQAITGALLFGLALSETAALLSCIMGGALLLSSAPLTWAILSAETGVFLAMAIPASLVGFLSYLPHGEGLEAIARQPFYAARLSYFIAFILSMMQVSVVLGLLISFVIKYNIGADLTLHQGLVFMAIGMACGLGSVGPLIGMSRFTATACSMIGRYPESYGPIVSFSFLSQALIETPILFAFFIALFMIWNPPSQAIAAFSAALTIGISTFGPGIASGAIASASCVSIGITPDRASLFSYASLLAQTFVDVAVIYGVIIALFMVF